MIVSVSQAREGVVVATVVRDELRVLVLNRVLLSAHEEHMLQKVCGAKQGLWVECGADVNVESCSTLISFIILNEQAANAVVKLDALVLALVALRGCNLCVCLHSGVFKVVCVLVCSRFCTRPFIF